MERDAWLEERRKTIGSSEAPTIWNLGYSGSSWYAMYADKVLGIAPTFSASTERAMRRGVVLEPFIRQEAGRELGVELLHNEGYHSFACEKHPHLSASLDSWYVLDNQIIPVELKSVGDHTRHEWDGDSCPLRYQVQLGHQLIVVDAPFGYVVAMCGDDLFVRRMDRDAEFDDAHLKLCNEFWWHVENKIAPEVDASSGTTEAIKKRWPKEKGPRVDGTDEIDQLTEEIERWENELDVLVKCIEKRKNRLRELIGDAEGIVSPSGVEWTWKVQKTAGYVVEPRESRVLRRVGKRKEKA